MKVFRSFVINETFYILLEVVKASVLIFFFLYELFLIHKYNNWQVFPSTKLEFLFFVTYLIFTILAWLLGERKKTFLVFSYFITFQIIGLAIILKDPLVIPRILIPIFLVYLTLFLFKSPKEFEEEKRENQFRKILDDLEKSQEKIDFYEKTLEALKKEYTKILEEKEKIRKIYKEQKVKTLEELLKEKDKILEDYKNKISELENTLENLRSNNAQLWEILEELDKPPKNKKEVSKLRRERKKLLKENLKLKAEIKDLNEKVTSLMDENLSLKEKLDSLQNNLSVLLAKLELKQKEIDRLINLSNRSIGNYLNLLLDRVELTPQALADLNDLSEDFLPKVIKTLKKLNSLSEGEKSFETLEVKGKNIYKYKLSGGRIYFSIERGKYKVLGILEGEDDKRKRRFISERFS